MLPLYIYVVSFLAIVVVAWFYRNTQKPANFPPGPPRLPLLGSLPFMKRAGHPFNLLHAWYYAAEKWGPLVGFYLGAGPAVLINDLDILKDLFKRDELAARPSVAPNDEHRIGSELLRKSHPEMGKGRQPGPIIAHGPYQIEMRRFILRQLRDLGFGKASMEDQMNAELSKLCAVYDQLEAEGQPVVMQRSMNLSILNSVWCLLAGDTLELGDPKMDELVRNVDDLFKYSNPQDPLTEMLPHTSMAKWPIIRNLTGFTYAQKTFKNLNNFIMPYIKEHQATLDEDNLRDFFDVWLLEMRRTTDPKSCFYGQLGLDSLINTAIDMFLAGSDTTSMSLTWMFFYMVHHQDIQAKIHQEIDDVIGQDRMPSLTDRDALHYTQAALHEGFRASSLAFLAVPHCALQEVQYKGYVIPKNATVFGNLYYIMNDPKKWTEPQVFKPERFLDDRGRFVPSERVVPFSVGKRYCLGQSLAEKEFFLFFTGLMQRFEFRAAPGYDLPGYNLDATHPSGLARSPPPYKVLLRKRC